MYGYTEGDVRATQDAVNPRSVTVDAKWNKVNALVSTLNVISVQTREFTQVLTAKIHSREYVGPTDVQLQDLHSAFIETVKTINAIVSSEASV